MDDDVLHYIFIFDTHQANTQKYYFFSAAAVAALFDVDERIQRKCEPNAH